MIFKLILSFCDRNNNGSNLNEEKFIFVCDSRDIIFQGGEGTKKLKQLGQWQWEFPTQLINISVDWDAIVWTGISTTSKAHPQQPSFQSERFYNLLRQHYHLETNCYKPWIYMGYGTSQ